MYSLFDKNIRRKQRRKIVKKSSSKIISMFFCFTIQKENFKNHNRNYKIYFYCDEYRLFRCNSFMRYSKIQFVLRDRELCATISTISTSISWIKFVDFVVRMFSWFCIDVIQTTKWKRKRKRNRQKKFKRVIKNLDHCIFYEIFFEIRNFFFCFVYSFFVSISLLFQLLRIFFVIDTFVTTYSNRLSKTRLQTMRESFRIKK